MYTAIDFQRRLELDSGSWLTIDCFLVVQTKVSAPLAPRFFFHLDCSRPDEHTVGKNSSFGHMHLHHILHDCSTEIIVEYCILFFALLTLYHFQLLHPIYECQL